MLFGAHFATPARVVIERKHQDQNVSQYDAELDQLLQHLGKTSLRPGVVHPTPLNLVQKVRVSQDAVRVKVEMVAGDLDAPPQAKAKNAVAYDTAPPQPLEQIALLRRGGARGVVMCLDSLCVLDGDGEPGGV